MDGWMDGWMDGRKVGQMDGRTVGRMVGQMYGRMDGRKGGGSGSDGWMYGRRVGGSDGLCCLLQLFVFNQTLCSSCQAIAMSVLRKPGQPGAAAQKQLRKGQAENELATQLLASGCKITIPSAMPDDGGSFDWECPMYLPLDCI